MNAKKIGLTFTGLLMLSQLGSVSTYALGGDHTVVPRPMVRTTLPMPDTEDRLMQQQQQLEDQRPVTSNTFVAVMAVIIVGLLFYVIRTSSKRRMH